jgi:hypothetical protein
MSDDLSDALSGLIVHHLASMDHVAVLLALKAKPELARDLTALAASQALSFAVVERVLLDLVSARIVRRDGAQFRFDPPPALSATLDELNRMYHTRPVALVRAIYARPPRAATSFADAFRLRKGDE